MLDAFSLHHGFLIEFGQTIPKIEAYGNSKLLMQCLAVVGTTPFYPQIKIKGVQIKIKGLQIKITGYQIKIRGHQIKIKGLQVKIRGLQIKIKGIQIKTYLRISLSL